MDHHTTPGVDSYTINAMPSPEKSARKVCASKRRFLNLAEAQAAASHERKPYLCPVCGGYHLTTRKGVKPSPAPPVEERKPTFDNPLALGKQKPTGKQEGATGTVIAECVGTVKPNGIVRLRLGDKEFNSTEAVQPAPLRPLLKAGVKVRVSIQLGPPFRAKVLGLVK